LAILWHDHPGVRGVSSILEGLSNEKIINLKEHTWQIAPPGLEETTDSCLSLLGYCTKVPISLELTVFYTLSGIKERSTGGNSEIYKDRMEGLRANFYDVYPKI